MPRCHHLLSSSTLLWGHIGPHSPSPPSLLHCQLSSSQTSPHCELDLYVHLTPLWVGFVCWYVCLTPLPLFSPTGRERVWHTCLGSFVLSTISHHQQSLIKIPCLLVVYCILMRFMIIFLKPQTAPCLGFWWSLNKTPTQVCQTQVGKIEGKCLAVWDYMGIWMLILTVGLVWISEMCGQQNKVGFRAVAFGFE